MIDHLNGAEKATAYLRQIREQGHVLAITRAEVLAELDPTKIAPVGRLLDAFPLVAMDGSVADHAAEFRLRCCLRLLDAIQAVAVRRCELATCLLLEGCRTHT